MVRTSVLFRGWMLTVLHQSRQGVNRLMFRMSRCFLAIWVTSAFASSIDAGWFCGDRGGCRVRAASVRCPNNDQSLCQPLFIVDPIRQDVARVVAQPLVSPASPGPLAITLTSSVNVKSIGPSRWPVYELNPNLGRARRSGRGGFSSPDLSGDRDRCPGLWRGHRIRWTFWRWCINLLDGLDRQHIVGRGRVADRKPIRDRAACPGIRPLGGPQSRGSVARQYG